jgi:hypothetical protein
VLSENERRKVMKPQREEILEAIGVELEEVEAAGLGHIAAGLRVARFATISVFEQVDLAIKEMVAEVLAMPMSEVLQQEGAWRGLRGELIHEVFLYDDGLRDLVGEEGWAAVTGPLDQVAVVARGWAGNEPDDTVLQQLSAEHGGKSVWVVEF